jgi:hypothetical protein
MTITESLQKVKELLERIDNKAAENDFEEAEITLDVDDYIAITNIYTELKKIQETILKLGWEKIGSGN